MSSGFSTERYLIDTQGNSSTRLRSKCKRVCIYCFGLSLLVGSWGVFFALGYHYNQSQSGDTPLLEDI